MVNICYVHTIKEFSRSHVTFTLWQLHGLVKITLVCENHSLDIFTGHN